MPPVVGEGEGPPRGAAEETRQRRGAATERLHCPRSRTMAATGSRVTGEQDVGRSKAPRKGNTVVMSQSAPSTQWKKVLERNVK